MIGRRRVLGAGLCLPFAATALPGSGMAQDGDPAIDRFVAALPKAEYHVHLEGTLEAEMKFALAKRNGITLPYPDVAAMKRSYVYHDLPSFLAIYYEGMKVLVTERDFHDLALAYLTKAAAQNILHAEMFFDPQEHLKRGVPMAAVIGGITRARMTAARRYGISSGLILCFVRDLPPDTAMTALDAALPMKDRLVAVGLDSDEKGHPPIAFAAHFAKARAAGLKVTMHCDVNQENTLGHLRQAIVELRADRIDHGGNVLQSPELVAAARERGLHFTACPTFSGTLRGGPGPGDVVRGMIDAGLNFSINSDDPAYMGSAYLTAVMADAARRSALTRAEMVAIERNAFGAAWVPEARRRQLIARLDAFGAAQNI